MNIAQIRRMRGLTQSDLADMVKASQPTISRAERGDDGTTLEVLRSIAAALGVPLAELFTDNRTKAELELLEVFRKLPEARQQGWLDMARLSLADHPPPDPET